MKTLVRTIILIVLIASLPANGMTLSQDELARLRRALAPLHEQFDPAENMLRKKFSSPGYHTTLKTDFVHPTRESLRYAVALLDMGDEALRVRAEAIIRRVIALQDQDPTSKTYGIWSWFLEEPLENMSPPDWNWADFCGAQLLQAAVDHRDRLSPETRSIIDEAIRHATASIRKRNVGPGYTNIAIMGTYVTLVAAELFGDDDLRDYAMERWRRFHEFTMHHGGFNEYNSPTYTLVALKELGRMRLHVKNAEARRLTEEICRHVWEEIAQHFHPPTRQWGGPHSRAYTTLLGADALALIQRATERRIDFNVDLPAIDDHRLPVPCPRDLESFFTTLTQPRELRKTFVKAQPPFVGTTYLHPAFTIGSINRGDFWNQRRALVAYWGTAKNPSYLHVRFLHDDYDYASAQFFSVQRGGDVLAAINFATDGGDTHPSLDRLKNATIRAKDLRVRFEFGGAAAAATLNAPRTLGEVIPLRFGDVRVSIGVPHIVFDPEAPRWEAGRSKECSWLDLVLYSGAEKDFNFAEIKHAAIAFALRISTTDTSPLRVSHNHENERLELKSEGLRLDIPTRPGKLADLQRDFTAELRE